MKLHINISKNFIILLFIVSIYFFALFLFDLNNNNNNDDNIGNTDINIGKDNTILKINSINNNISEYKKYYINGNSMEPTLENNDIVYVDENFSDFKRGDIITFKLKTRNEIFIKRIVALEEDNIIFAKDGNIYLNGKIYEENYVKENQFYLNNNLKLLLKQLEFYNNTIPKGSVLVMGDNRQISYDSSAFGLIPREYILGKVMIEN